jgi:hypothetical protein
VGIAVTVQFSECREQAAHAGMASVLTKPVITDKLFAVLKCL